MLIQLTETTYVAADTITKLEVSYPSNCVYVHCGDSKYTARPAHKEALSVFHARLIAEINEK